MRKLFAPALLLFACTTTVKASPDWDKIGDVVAPYLSDNEAIEVCIEEECNTYVYHSLEAQTDGEAKKQPVDGEDIVDIIDGLLNMGTVSGKIKITHSSKTTTTNADGSTSTKETNTSVEVEGKNGKKN